MLKHIPMYFSGDAERNSARQNGCVELFYGNSFWVISREAKWKTLVFVGLPR